MTGKLLMKLDTVKFIIANHTVEYIFCQLFINFPLGVGYCSFLYSCCLGLAILHFQQFIIELFLVKKYNWMGNIEKLSHLV